MADEIRKPIIDRLAALMAGPFLLGRRALDLVWTDAPDAPPGPAAPTRITVTSPEHAIKRRG
jgi:hypothetical protein